MKIAVSAFACCVTAATLVHGQAPADPLGDKHDYIVAGEVEGAPAACSTEAVAARAAEFFSAMNAGAPEVAERFFGRRPAAPFQWFSFSDQETGFGFETFESPGGLNEHFAMRHASGNRWVLGGLEFTGWVPERNGVGFLIFFEYLLRSPVSGNESRQLAFGKGEFHCPSFTFVVMSLGLKDEEMWNRLFRIHILAKRVSG